MVESSSHPFLSCRDIHKTYRMGDTDVHALAGISVDIKRGEFVSIMGPSGSGKSTFMNLVGALDVPTSGTLAIDGELVNDMTADELAHLRNRKIGFVFQQFNLLGRATALNNVMLPLRYAQMDRPAAIERAQDCLKRVGLEDRMDHLPNQLSGGQQQRVAVARALANNPEAILADEPTGALDSTTGHEIMDLFGDLHNQGITVIIVTHDADVAAKAQREIHFYDGLVIDGPKRQPGSDG